MAVASDPSFVPRLVELVRAADPAAPEMPRYLEGLGAAGDQAAAPVVLTNLDSEPPAVRAAAARAAGRLGLVEAGPRLAKMLEDDDWWVRVRAGEALADLGELGQTLLQGVAHRGGGRTARAAQLAMAERGRDR
jgi:HEAT repeat protein